MKKQKSFQASVELLHPMISWIREELAHYSVAESFLTKLELALEEAIVNIIRHAYQERPEEILIQLECIPKVGARITLIDNGPAFNPLERQKSFPNSSIPLEEIEEGGLGILFIKKSVDQVLYERRGDQNVLTLVKKFY